MMVRSNVYVDKDSICEGSMAALYDGLGVPDSVTAVVVLIYRIISFWLPALLGFPLIPYLQRSSKQAAPQD